MSTPRLTGLRLTLARIAAETPVGSRLMRLRAAETYRQPELMGLPEDARAFYELQPEPRPGAPARTFGDEDLADDAPVGSAAALRAAYASGQATPLTVLDGIQARLGKKDFGVGRHSPFVALTLQRAQAAAQASTLRWQAGKPLSVLDGVPVAVKDEHDMTGLPTRGGTAYRDALAASDSFVVQCLDAAGAVVLGKTHTTEWGMSPLGQSPHFDLPRNPWSADHAAGGSSTGSAVAVALGLCPVAVGSDGGGSIRIPAGLCGIAGLKPSFSLVGRTGDIFGPSSVSHIGPLGSCVSDLVDLLEVIAGVADPDDPQRAWAPPRDELAVDRRRALGRGIRGARLGIPEGEWRDADAATQQACQEVVRALEAEGARLVDVRIPHIDLAPAIGVAAIATETMGKLTDDLAGHRSAMGDDLRLLLAVVGRTPARDYIVAQRTRATLRRRLARIMAGLDLLVLPTVASPAVDWPLSEGRRGVLDTDATQQVSRFSFLANITGLPAGTTPVGRSGALPVGIQFVGDAWDDASVVAALAATERLGRGPSERPSGWSDLLG